MKNNSSHPAGGKMLKFLFGVSRDSYKWQKHDAAGCNTNFDSKSYLFQDVSCREKNSGPGILRTVRVFSIIEFLQIVRVHHRQEVVPLL